MSQQDLRIIQSNAGLTADVRCMIEQTRKGVARAVNTGMTHLYWRIGKRIQTEILENQRAKYGKEIASTLSRQLVEEIGIILCADKKEEQIELLELDQPGIHAAIEVSRARLEKEGGHSCPPVEK